MGQISPILRSLTDGVSFWCPGCKEMHYVRTKGESPVWGYNGNPNAPTFTPSILVRSGHFVPRDMPAGADRGCWCTYNAEKVAKGEPPAPFKCTVCHTFVIDGVIRFLGDCTHELAGQAVPIPPLPPEYQDAP